MTRPPWCCFTFTRPAVRSRAPPMNSSRAGLTDALALIDVRVLDHLIVAESI